jgi:hypothetical protein
MFQTTNQSRIFWWRNGDFVVIDGTFKACLMVLISWFLMVLWSFNGINSLFLVL